MQSQLAWVYTLAFLCGEIDICMSSTLFHCKELQNDNSINDQISYSKQLTFLTAAKAGPNFSQTCNCPDIQSGSFLCTVLRAYRLSARIIVA